MATREMFHQGVNRKVGNEFRRKEEDVTRVPTEERLGVTILHRSHWQDGGQYWGQDDGLAVVRRG